MINRFPCLHAKSLSPLRVSASARAPEVDRTNLKPGLVARRTLLGAAVGIGTLSILNSVWPIRTSARKHGPVAAQQSAPAPPSGSSSTPYRSFAPDRSGTMRSQDHLVSYLKQQGVVKSQEVEAALRATDRALFIDSGMPKSYAYHDSPLPIGHGETISAPHMHATCLELLRDHLRPGARVLDVGSGSGYLAVAMAHMVGASGKVFGIEKHPELTEVSIEHVRQAAPQLLESGVVELRAGNVLGHVLDNEEPFDAIHVGAAAAKLPDVLVRKLKPGARMVIPVGQQWDFQVMQCIDKDMQGHVHKHDLMWVRYVPLTEPGQDEE